MAKKTIGVMTGGGDCPGLNAVIRAVVKSAINDYGYDVIGFRDGYKGLVRGNFIKLKLGDVSGILDKGGTILGTTNNFDPFNFYLENEDGKTKRDMSTRIIENLKMEDIECLVVIGGEGTLSSANELAKMGVNIVGVPKTIDNDIVGTDITFGFMTAVNTATHAIDMLHSTAEAHHRVMILEVMGRRAGWIAIESGIAGGADIILIPEIPYDINSIARAVLKRKNAGKSFSIIVVAEGSAPKNGTPNIVSDVSINKSAVRFAGIGNDIAEKLEKLTEIETRVTVLGYLQRGGSPSPFDRVLSTRFGVEAIRMISRREYGKMVSIRNGVLSSVPLSEVAGKVRLVPFDGELVEIAKGIGVSFGDD